MMYNLKHPVWLANKVPKVASKFKWICAGFILKIFTNSTDAGREYNIEYYIIILFMVLASSPSGVAYSMTCCGVDVLLKSNGRLLHVS